MQVPTYLPRNMAPAFFLASGLVYGTISVVSNVLNYSGLISSPSTIAIRDTATLSLVNQNSLVGRLHLNSHDDSIPFVAVRVYCGLVTFPENSRLRFFTLLSLPLITCFQRGTSR